MKASILRDFFLGRVTTAELARDLEGAWSSTGRDSARLNMHDDFDTSFTVTSAHLVQLCDAVLAGEVRAESLAAVGFGLIASDYFDWDGASADGDRVANTLYDWSSPEINYALKKSTVAKFRHRLLTGENTFVRADLFSASA